VRTVMMEVDSEISRDKLDSLASFLNERLQGLTLKEIRETFEERVTDYKYKEPELIQMFMNSIDKLYYDEEKGRKIFVGGTGDIITQPEFDDRKNFKSVIDLTEDKNLVVHIFQKPGKGKNEISISIGAENQEKKLRDYSVVCTSYSFGDIKGKIGIIGPKRMNYKKMISLIEYTSKLISEK
jgi:heat-inducible transcriptional repressor